MLTVDDIAEFTWSFGCFFHLETEHGNYEWSDPDYGGDNTIRPSLPYKDWCKYHRIPYGRCKGKHLIHDYCGYDVLILE